MTAAGKDAWFRAALDGIDLGTAIFDRDHSLVLCNALYLMMYGLSAELGLPGTPLRQILAARAAAGTEEESDTEDTAAARITAMRRGEDVSQRKRLKDGRLIYARYSPLPDGGWVTSHYDVTEVDRLQCELTHLAYHDALTGLPNRTLFTQELQRRFSAVPGESFAVLCLDLDNFKVVNDSFGHTAGDALLRRIAKRIAGAVGENDVLARMGSDEFALLHPLPAGATDAQSLADRLLSELRPPFEFEGQSLTVSASLGLAVAPADGDNVEHLLRHADFALQSAKRERSGTARRFVPALARAAANRLRLERDLQKALEEGEFELHYQPIVDLRAQRLSGFETLLRWRHPEQGLISPAEFIPVAEDIGLIAPIGEWVIREAFAEAARWPSPLSVAVNVSSVQFHRGNLVGMIMNALASSGLRHDRVEIEITESVLLENNQANLDILHQLHGLGLRVALDDFGTGYSGLGYLLSFPFDKIKLDGSFVRALASAESAHTIVQAVADIGRRMGITTTAEGIETPEQLRKVHAAGYTEGQGYLIARPMARDAVARLLDERYDQMPAPPAAVRIAG